MDEYTNQSLYIMLRGVRDDVIEIKEQVKKTNGRVRALEIWRGVLVGGFSIISFIVFPLIIYIFKNQ